MKSEKEESMLRIAIYGFLSVSLFVGCSSSEPQKPATPKSKAAKESPAEGYKVVESLSASGSLEGAVLYTGGTQDVAVNVDRDKATCSPAGEGPSGALKVKEGRVENVVIEILGVKEGVGFTQKTVKIDNVGCVFVPRVALAHVGDTFISHNSDPVFHNAKLDLIKGSKSKRIANLPVPLQGSNSPERTLKKAGVVKVSCDAHLWMRSTVYVSDHPYTALSNEKGDFSIAQIPPGTYSVKIWHELLGEKTETVQIEAGKKARLEVSL